MISKTLNLLFLLSAALAAVPAGALEAGPSIEVRVWRIEFSEGGRTEIDWQQAFDELQQLETPLSASLPRHLPASGSPLTGLETAFLQQPAPAPLVLPPAPSPRSSAPRMSTYSIQHRDPAKVDRLVKQMTGQISDIPTRGSAPATRWEIRDPVRTVGDPGSGRILVTGVDRQASRAPTPPPPQPEFSPVPAKVVLDAPIAARLTSIGAVPFHAFARILKRQGHLKQLFARRTPCVEGLTAIFELPFIHSRNEKGSFTVGLELNATPRRLDSEAWVIRLQPHVLSFEQAPRTIRVVLEQERLFRAGETLALTHVLDPECARAPSMFEKAPPPARTIVFITRPPTALQP